MMDATDFYKTIKKVQEKKGYYFNRDKQQTMALIEGLITNRQRYGYMACPCRLASGDLENDRDIICPCEYREADVKEFGSCYCALYVSLNFNENDKTRNVVVPERRPPEKTF